METYVLQVSSAEKRIITESMQKAKHTGEKADAAALLLDSLKQLKPFHAVVIEAPADVDPSRITVTTSFEMPIDVYVVSSDENNRIAASPVKHIKDPERVLQVMSSIRLNAVLQPLIRVTKTLLTACSVAVDAIQPDIPALADAFREHGELYKKAAREVFAVERETEAAAAAPV